VSDTATIEDAFLSSDSYTTFDEWDPPRAEAWRALTKRVARSRGYGDFWSHMLVAEGAVEISAEPAVFLWDLAALQVIVEEAGGTFTDLAGRPTPDGGSAVATNGRLHAEVLDLLAPASGPGRG
jgi:histidinol-phosphatase